jgi:hypothetical protein
MLPFYTYRFLSCALLLFGPIVAPANPVEMIATRSEASSQRLTQPAFDRQIERVLQNPEYNWRERDTSNQASLHPKTTSIIEQWMMSLRRMLVSLGSWVRDLVKSLLKPLELNAPNPSSEVSRFSPLLNVLGYVLWAAFAGTLILFLIRLIKLKATKLPPSIISLQKPDLAAEEVEANQLPDDEWYALAREKMAAGEFRQAQRALFLAILSYLASQRFITVERWKTNADYENELGRKVKNRSELSALFAESRLGFERCWYGPVRLTLTDLEKYNIIYERIKHAAA